MNTFYVYKYMFLFLLSSSVFIILFAIRLYQLYIENKPFTSSLNTAVPLLVKFMENCINQDGKLVYLLNTNYRKIKPCASYSVMHHAEFLLSLFLYEKHMLDFTLQDKRMLASDFFIKNYIEKHENDFYYLKPNPQEEKCKSDTAKISANGLALAALSNLADENKIDINVLTGLGSLILEMQMPNGNFFSDLNLITHEKSKDIKDIYCTGFACMGLLSLYMVNPEEKWLNAAKKSILYFAQKQYGKEKIPYDSKILYAVKLLIKNPDAKLTASEKTLLIKFSEKLIDITIKNQITNRRNPFSGSFLGNVNLAYTADIMTGYAHAYSYMEDDKVKVALMRAMRLGTEFLSRYQVKYDYMKGGIAQNAYWRHKNADDSAKVIRIDYLAKTLSAWVLFQALFK